MTIYDISEKAGVSIATVSRVLNGSANVSPLTRKKVMDVVDRYSYTPNAYARGLGLSSVRSVGILCSDTSDIYLARAVSYLENMLRENGYDSIVRSCGHEHASIVRDAALLESKKVDSIILVGSPLVGTTEPDNSYIRDIASRIPVMLLNADYGAPNVYSCLCDDHQSFYAVTEELIGSGRRNILYIYDLVSYSSCRKLSGYNDAMTAHGLAPKSLMITGQADGAGLISAVTEHMESVYPHGSGIDAVITSDDLIALSVIKYASRSGISIPQELAVIGCNNTMLSTAIEPELSSIDNRLEHLCSKLVSLLTEVLSGGEVPRSTTYASHLIKRYTS